jgi:DNA-binding winged helix-turn-helix (wHTH) protein/TolB-like protein/Tfp pilus assembly protein PilF
VSLFYRFGDFVLDPRKRSLSRAGSNVTLTSKAFDVLHFLVQNPNRLITKEELLKSVWGDAFVEEGNLTQYISHLRKALGDNVSENAPLIVTIARKGYQLTADVTLTETPDSARQSTVHTSTIEPSSSKDQRVLPSSVAAPVAAAPKHWWKAAIAGLSAACFAVVCFASWKHFEEKTPPRSQKSMLAVLPFENRTGDPDKEYLADGLTEETISEIALLSPDQLGVIPRSSVMGYKHKDERLDQIGRNLSVQYVLENSLHQNGNHLRLTAQLIQIKNKTPLWSREFDYAATDILNIEDEVAKTVAREIGMRLTSRQQPELAQARPVNPEAFDAYLQGHYYFERDTEKDANMAAKYFERATQLDPSYALAWVGLSRARNWQSITGLVPSESGHRSAREAVERALTLNPNLALAHAQMARLKRQVDFDWPGSDASIQRANALEPGNPEIVRSAAANAAFLGRFDEALPLAHQAVDLDPLNAGSWQQLGEIDTFAGNLDQAEADCKRAQELRPDHYRSHTFLTYIYLMQGRPQDALAEIKRIDSVHIQTFLYAITYHALGREKESDAALRQFIAKYKATDSYLIAQIYAFRNQSDESFAWLNRAYATRNEGLVFTKVEPLLKNLHSDPRFPALLKKLNFPT